MPKGYRTNRQDPDLMHGQGRELDAPTDEDIAAANKAANRWSLYWIAFILCLSTMLFALRDCGAM